MASSFKKPTERIDMTFCFCLTRLSEKCAEKYKSKLCIDSHHSMERLIPGSHSAPKGEQPYKEMECAIQKHFRSSFKTMALQNICELRIKTSGKFMQYALYTNNIHHGLLECNNYSCFPNYIFWGGANRNASVQLHVVRKAIRMGFFFRCVVQRVSCLTMKVGRGLLFPVKALELSELDLKQKNILYCTCYGRKHIPITLCTS